QGMQDKTVMRKTAPDLRCPRCGELVVHDANYCPNCRLLLSPSESGLHLRVHPQASAAQPSMAPAPFANANSHTVPPASSSMVPVSRVPDQPTLVPMSPEEGVEHSPVLGSEVTWKKLGSGPDDPNFPYGIPQLPNKRLGFMVGTRSDPGLKRKYKPNED